MTIYWTEREKVLLAFERKWLIHMWLMFDGNLSHIAEAGAIDRKTVYRIMKRTGLTRGIISELIG